MADTTNNILKRQIDSIRYSFENYPVIALIGARQTGKTTILKEFAKDQKVFDLERQIDFDLIERDAEFFLENQSLPIFIDEAQLSERLFRAIRVFIDKNRSQNGQVVISGSSSPELLTHITESLAGRIAIIEVNTLTIAEIEQNNISSFYICLNNADTDNLKKLCLTKRNYLDLIWWGGYPEPLVRQNQEFKNDWSQNYIRSYIDRDIRRLYPDLQIEMYQRFIKMLALSSGEIINFSEWASALGVSEPTAKKYLSIAEGTFLFRRWPAYAFHPTKRLIKSPKGSLRDTGLLCALLRIEQPQDLFAHPKFGAIFESYVIEQIIKSLQHQRYRFDFSFYRTKDQQEVDLVLEFSKHKIPIEIKVGKEIRSESLKSIKSFIADFQSPFGCIINNSENIQEIAPKVFQIPFEAI